ncbi:unnamed protein product, partial [Prorocentrum cordatum]
DEGSSIEDSESEDAFDPDDIALSESDHEVKVDAKKPHTDFTMKQNWAHRNVDDQPADGAVPSKTGYAIFAWKDGDRWCPTPRVTMEQIGYAKKVEKRVEAKGSDAQGSNGKKKTRDDSPATGQDAKSPGSISAGGKSLGKGKSKGKKGKGMDDVKVDSKKGRSKGKSSKDVSDKQVGSTKGASKGKGNKGKGVQVEQDKHTMQSIIAAVRPMCEKYESFYAGRVGINLRPELANGGWEVFIKDRSGQRFQRTSRQCEIGGEEGLRATVTEANNMMIKMADAEKAAQMSKQLDT